MTIYGFDSSHYDAPDQTRAVAEGFQFFTHKAGGDQDDPEIGPWWSLMKPLRAQVLLGAYWVLYPGSPALRADRFLARLDATCDGWRDGPFILQVDAEIWGGDRNTLPGKADLTAFCDRLVARVPALVPIVYAPKWCYGDSLTGLPYPLWASSYVTGSGPASALYPGDSSGRWNPYSGQTPAVLQFTSSAVIAGQTTCDANAFRGTLAELTGLLAPGWTQEDDMPTLDELADAIDDPNSHLGKVFRRAAVSYTGGGLPAGKSVLNVLNDGYGTSVQLLTMLQAFVTAEQQRDAGESAQIAALTAAVQALAAGTGKLTDEQVDRLIEAARQAGQLAAASATSRLEDEIQSLRHHLGDDTVTPASQVTDEGGQPVDEPRSGLPVYDQTDAFTRRMREARQPDIEGPGR